MVGWVDRAVRRAALGKFAKSALSALPPLLLLGGCVHEPTLEELQDRCMKKGGMLMIVYTQEITMSGPGDQIPTPGRCVMPENFDKPENPLKLPAEPPADRPPAKPSN